MESEITLPDISNEFLSKVLHRKVKSFTIKPGSNVGDNYMSVLFSIEAQLEEKDEDGNCKSVSLLSKCFPAHPARQEYVKISNVFYVELKVYDTFLPALEKFANENGIEGKLPFSPLVGGEAVDFITAKQNGDKASMEKVYGYFDNFIMMPDLRAQNFRMADIRELGLDYEHCKILMKTYAKYHAISWAYKQKNNVTSLLNPFPFLYFELPGSDFELFHGVMVSCIERILGLLDSESMVYKGVKRFEDQCGDFIKAVFLREGTFLNLADFHSKKPDATGPEWRVALHGDCWANNLLFRYDEATNQIPKEVVLVDLQMVREGCPTVDLAHSLYTTTTTEFRKQYLDELLQLYHDDFLHNCQTLGVTPLHGFSMEELKRRFHISKIFGYSMAIMVLPILLKDKLEMRDMEKFDHSEGMHKMFDYINDKTKSNSRFENRILQVTEELHNEGVL